MLKATAKRAPVDKVFRAFSDPTRLRILHLLASVGECCVGDIVTILRIEQPTASRHLAYLRGSNLVTLRRAKNWVYYSVAPAETPFHKKLLDCLSSCFTEVPELRRDTARAKKLKVEGGCCPEESYS